MSLTPAGKVLILLFFFFCFSMDPVSLMIVSIIFLFMLAILVGLNEPSPFLSSHMIDKLPKDPGHSCMYFERMSNLKVIILFDRKVKSTSLLKLAILLMHMPLVCLLVTSWTQEQI